MSGHSRWSRIESGAFEKLGDTIVVDGMIQFCQGYILAVEDALKDVEAMNYDAEEMSVEYVDGHSSAMESFRSRLNQSLLEAQRTLDQFRRR